MRDIEGHGGRDTGVAGVGAPARFSIADRSDSTGAAVGISPALNGNQVEDGRLCFGSPILSICVYQIRLYLHSKEVGGTS